MVATLHVHCSGAGLILGQELGFPQDARLGKKKKKISGWAELTLGRVNSRARTQQALELPLGRGGISLFPGRPALAPQAHSSSSFMPVMKNLLPSVKWIPAPRPGWKVPFHRQVDFSKTFSFTVFMPAATKMNRFLESLQLPWKVLISVKRRGDDSKLLMEREAPQVLILLHFLVVVLGVLLGWTDSCEAWLFSASVALSSRPSAPLRSSKEAGA